MRAIRCAGWLAIAGFILLVARFWHPVFAFTALIQLDAHNQAIGLPQLRENPVYVYRNTGPYDGLIYAQMAYDPSLRDPALRRAIDNLTYRGRRILVPALAWAAAGGRAARIAPIYALLNPIAWLLLAALLWRVIPVSDARSFVAWGGILFSAGALACVRLALTDLIAAGLLLAGVWSCERGRGRAGVVVAGLGGLSRETALIGVGGLWDRPWASRRNFLRSIGAALPLLLWMGYIRWRVGPGDPGFGNFSWPAAGFLEKWAASWRALGTQGDKALAITTLLSVAALTVQVAWFFLRAAPCDRWWRMGAPYIVLLLFLGRAVWEDFPGAAFRTLLPLTIAFNVLAARRRAPWAWLILGNLTVGSGLIALRDVPFDPGEVGRVRAGPAACEVRTGPGWYGAEKTLRHHWTWSSGHAATVDFQTWPAGHALLHCSAQLRSLAPRQVTISEGDRLLWRGAVGLQKSPAIFDVEVRKGRAEIVLHTAEPPVLEGSGNDARQLAFALYDLKVSFVDAPTPSH
ncbi:MAG TPA: hypothetical protein VFE31_05480 [Opitutaceae bacterium]|jgi:hypothetical protein|nr:hypothetical protein [Opitutaceae bacterium]